MTAHPAPAQEHGNKMMEDKKDIDTLQKRVSRLYYTLTPFFILIAIVPYILTALMPDKNIGLFVTCPLIIVALMMLLTVALIAGRNHSDGEFRMLANCFSLYAFLFLSAQILSFNYYFVMGCVNSGPREIFYAFHAIFLAGYLPLVYACWVGLIKYSEYAHQRSLLITSLVMFVATACLLTIVTLSINNSTNPNLDPDSKLLTLAYALLDTIVVYSLILLLNIYRKGRLHFYWYAVTLGMLLYSIGDISNAFITSFDLGDLAVLSYMFFILAYFYLTFSFAVVSYFHWKSSRLEPEGRYSVRQIFLVNKSGILIAHSGNGKDTMDNDIVSGMLTAVQDFIKDSFDAKQETKETLKRLQYGGMEINIEHGNHLFFAVVIDGVSTELLHSRMREAIAGIEKEYADELETWTGDRDGFPGVERYLKGII
jgi:hypothetical protein